MRPPSQALLTSVALDGAGVGATAAEVGRAGEAIDAAGIDMMLVGAAPPGLDALITAAWLAPRTRRAGLIAVLPALHALPFHTARALSALDFLSGARAGWAPTTLGHAAQAPQFGPAAAVAPGETLAKALDFIDATTSLWNSWDTDALIIDKAQGLYLHADKVRRVDHRGPYFQVMGPLNAARPPQGYPVLVQSDLDPLWRRTADRADVLLVHAADPDVLAARRAEVAHAGGDARILAVLTPGQRPVQAMADDLEAWLEASLVDGVHWAPSRPVALDWVLQDMLPELRRRRLVSSSSAHGVLRVRLGGPAVAPTRATAPVQAQAWP